MAEAKIEALEARIRSQQERIDRLEALISGGTQDGMVSGDAPNASVSRAGLFKMAAIGASGVALAGALGTSVAGAATKRSETTDTDFVATGTSANGYGAAYLAISGTNLRGVFVSGNHVGVFGFTTDAQASIYAEVHAGVHGKSYGGYGLYGLSHNGAAVSGTSVNGNGSEGFTAGSMAAGVAGSNTGHGKGGQFSSTAGPQVGLTPSASATHPATGHGGDLFVDSAHRLWYCHGGSNWTKLA